jgi:hypothetical protein
MSTKWDGRIDKIEEKINAKKGVPPEARGPHILWPEPGVKADFSEIKADLMEKYGTTEGAEFISISWGAPESTI